MKLLDRKFSEKNYLKYILPLFLGIQTLLFPAFLDNIRFVFISGFSFVFFIYLFFVNTNNSLPKISWYDISWGIFIVICFSSYWWATNGSLIWFSAFSWLGLLLWLLVSRIISNDELGLKYIENTLIVCFFLTLIYHIIALFTNVSIGIEWNNFFGENHNYTSCYLLILYPFLLFSSSKWRLIFILQIIVTILVLYILLMVTSSRGAVVASVVLFFYFVALKYNKKYFLLSILGLSVFIIFILFLYFWNFDLLSNIPSLRDFKYSNNSIRPHMMIQSIEAFLENPLLGIGLGNWQTVIYDTNLSEIKGLNEPSFFYRIGNHDMFTQLLTEVGILGFFALMLPILEIIRSGWKNKLYLTSFQKGLYSSLLIYLVLSVFYRDVNFYELHFSGVEFIAFLSIGVLSNKHTYIPFSRFFQSLLIIISFICSLWFVYYIGTDFLYRKSMNNTLSPLKKIELLEEIFHPTFKTAHGYYGDHLGTNKSLALQLAKEYQGQGNDNMAESYYQIALRLAPYDGYILIDYAKFLLHIKNDPSKSYYFARKLHEIQNNNYDNNLLLAEIYFYEKDFEQAEKYLHELKSDWFEMLMRKDKPEVNVDYVETMIEVSNLLVKIEVEKGNLIKISELKKNISEYQLILSKNTNINLNK